MRCEVPDRIHIAADRSEVGAGRVQVVHLSKVGGGHPSLPVPLSFLFCLEMDGPNPSAMRELLGLDFRSLLHGEQGFVYHRLAYAGDVLRFAQRIDNIYSKKGGMLEFVERSTRVTNQRGEVVAELSFVLVVRHQKEVAA